MLYVRRDTGGKVDGTARAIQKGWTGEQLSSNHPDVVAWRTPPAPTASDQVEAAIKASPALDAIMQKLAAMEGKTEAQMTNDLKGRGRKNR